MVPKIDIKDIEKLISHISNATEFLKSYFGRIRVITHYDCDGISSAAIMIRALQREGKSFHLSFIKQLSDDFIQELGKGEERLFIFLDLGSGQLGSIKEYILSRGSKVIVIDHHQIQGEENIINSPNIFHINPMTFEITENVSASGMTYLFSRTLNPENMDLSEIGIIGAIGDSQIGSVGSDWGLFGLNKEILKDAENAGKIRVGKGLRLWGRYTRPVHKALEFSVDPYIPDVTGSESNSIQFLQEIGIDPKSGNGWKTLSELTEEEQKALATGIIKERIKANHENPDHIFGEVYELEEKKDFRDAQEFATLLNACGKMDKAYMGIGLCLNDPKAFSKANSILNSYRKEIGRGVSWFNSNKELADVRDGGIYIDFGANLSEHLVSNVISIVNRSGMLPNKPTFAFADADDGKVKISARASDDLVKRGVNLKEIMEEAMGIVEGEGGGHAGAAGATIERNKRDAFINIVEDILKPGKKDLKKADNIKQEVKEVSNERESTGNGEDRGKEQESPTGKKMEGEGLVRYLST